MEILWTTKASVSYMNMQADLGIKHKCIKGFFSLGEAYILFIV